MPEQTISVLYGFGYIHVFESSLATQATFWVEVVESDDLNSTDPDGPKHNALAHISLAEAIRLRNQLTYLIERNSG